MSELAYSSHDQHPFMQTRLSPIVICY